jgi:hypothetical protein
MYADFVFSEPISTLRGPSYVWAFRPNEIRATTNERNIL